jgi:rod shape-determining protein MreD
MPSLLLIVFGFVLLVSETAIATLFPIYRFAPNVVLPIAILLGVSAESSLVRGASISFGLGYLLDLFSGCSMGLQTFALTASFFAARGAGLRLFPQGPVFQILLTFLMAVAFSATVLALRAIFEQPQEPRFAEGARETLVTLFESAAVTALVSPLIFAAARRIMTISSSKREERTVTR